MTVSETVVSADRPCQVEFQHLVALEWGQAKEGL